MASRGWRDQNGRNVRTPLGRGVARLRQVAQAAPDASGPVLGAMGLILEDAIKRRLSHPGTGRLYARGRRVHQASAPGEPPAVDTGHLRNSIGSEAVDQVLRVGAAAGYAPALEYGSARPVPGGVVFVQPRPFMAPAFAEVEDRLTAAGVVALQTLVRGPS